MTSPNTLPNEQPIAPREPWYKQYPAMLIASLERPFTLSSYLTVGALMLGAIFLFMLFLSKGCAPGAGPG